MSKFLSYLRNHNSEISKVFLFLISIVVLVILFPKEGKFKYEYAKGKPWLHSDLIAPFDFAIQKSKTEIQNEEKEALKQLSPYFNRDDEMLLSKKKSLINEFNTKWDLKYGKKKRKDKKREKSLEVCESIFDSIAQKGIIELVPELDNKPPDFKIMIIKNNVVSEVALKDMFTIHTADKYIQKKLADIDNIDREHVLSSLENILVRNITFDTEKTELEKKEILNKISPTRGMVQRGEKIISKGELVTESKYQILESLRIDYESKLGSSFKVTGIVAGLIILISVSMFSLFLFLLFFRKEVFANTKNLVLILIMVTGMVAITIVVSKFLPEYIYIIPFCLVPMIVGIFYDTRLALFAHLVTIIITALLVPNSYEFVFLQLFTGIVTILSILRLERRSQFFLTSLLVFLTYSVIYIGMTLIKEGAIEDINRNYFALFAGSAILTLFSYPIIFVFEKVFGLITDVTLLELSNTNNKLLRQLALKAPGTFQHSMQMANLAEAAIYEIGGNPLLIRTGAMYHDIGKMDSPLYFIENQTTGINPHDELTFDESATIIIEHVINGIEKARKNNLPEQIIDFIRTHHGTRRTEYFYTLAKQENPDEEVDPSVYTYPGPEPFSKETAVLMMADTVEAASRSLKKPDEEAISNIVDSVIDKQIESHQFDNAPITFRDIKTVRKIFKKMLMNIYHLRIEYPK
jgi:putative nucleotidyltransferase with HDIG domain